MGTCVVLEVLDRGAGYSTDGASEPVASEERGRGIKLMRMLVDNVEVAVVRMAPARAFGW